MVQMLFLKTNRLISNPEILRSLASILLMKEGWGESGENLQYSLHKARAACCMNMDNVEILKGCGSILISRASVNSVVWISSDHSQG